MKKTIITALAFLMSFGLTYAQDLKLGLKAGMNFSKLKTDNSMFHSENNAGYLAGVWGRIGGKSFHIQPEAYFTSKNTTVEIEPKDATGALVKGDLKFSNIDIPVLIGTNFPLGPIKARVQAGPLFSFVIDSDAKLKDNVSATFDQNMLKNYKDNFAAIVGGVGLDIFKLSVDLRYEHGLGNMSKYEGSKQTLNLWTIGLGYSFL